MSSGCPESARQVAAYAAEFLGKDEKCLGVILCEGVWGGIDVTLYQEVYPDFLVIPSGGCEHILKYISTVKKRLSTYTVVGLIDRDSRSKKEIRQLEREGIYCTKLPFIENIISCPEIIRMFAIKRSLKPDDVLEKLERNLFKTLCQKLRNTLPVNVPFAGKEDDTVKVTFKIEDVGGDVVEKSVDRGSILYAYRDKSVANEASFLLGLHGRKKYYEFYCKCLNDPEMREGMIKCARNYLPTISVEEEKKNGRD